jgi:putative MATE family efflux protein
VKGTKDLTQGPILRQLFTLAAPIMATSFIQMAYNLTDIAWLGHWDTASVAATGAAGMFTWLGNSVSSLTKVGAEVSVAQRLGQKDKKEALSFASHSVTIATITSLLFMALLLIWGRQFIELFDLEPPIVSLAYSYLRIVSTAMPFVFLSMSFTGIFNASGRSKMPFYINGIGLMTNMLLDPLLIFGFRLGVEGAAWATWLSQGVVCLLFVYQLKVKKTLFDHFRLFIKPKLYQTKVMLQIGLPVAALNTLFALLSFVITRFASEQGGHIGLLCYTAVGQIEAICWNTAQGLSTALSAFVAQNFGAGRMERVHHAYRSANYLSMSVGLVCTIFFVGWGGPIFSLFIPDPAAYQMGSDYMRIDGYSMIFMMIEITRQGLFYGFARTVPPAAISITGNAARIPLALFLITNGLGISAIWWAISISSIAKGTVSFIWFRILSSHLKEKGTQPASIFTKKIVLHL